MFSRLHTESLCRESFEPLDPDSFAAQTSAELQQLSFCTSAEDAARALRLSRVLLELEISDEVRADRICSSFQLCEALSRGSRTSAVSFLLEDVVSSRAEWELLELLGLDSKGEQLGDEALATVFGLLGAEAATECAIRLLHEEERLSIHSAGRVLRLLSSNKEQIVEKFLLSIPEQAYKLRGPNTIPRVKELASVAIELLSERYEEKNSSTFFISKLEDWGRWSYRDPAPVIALAEQNSKPAVDALCEVSRYAKSNPAMRNIEAAWLRVAQLNRSLFEWDVVEFLRQLPGSFRTPAVRRRSRVSIMKVFSNAGISAEIVG